MPTQKIPPGELAYSTLSLACGDVVVAEGPDRGRRVMLSPGATVRVGSAPENDLVLNDPAVSARHLVLQARAGRVVVRDLESTNGTFLDQVRVSEAFPGAASRIGLGRSVLRFEPRSEEFVVFPSASDGFGLLSGRSQKMRELFGLLERVAPTDLSVLVLGETGTGKELAARSIHLASPRSKGPFAVLDCGRASREFLESELFGHERGAFTGAVERRSGALEQAGGGTLFLDELGELGLELQPKLLRALETREVRPLGSSAARPVDVRIVAATNRDLDASVAQGSFREDLFFRLSVVQVRLPPLRERREDIPMLVAKLLAARGNASVTAEALAVLAAQLWRGNVRELANVLDRALAVSGREVIRPGHLMLLSTRTASAVAGTAQLAGMTLAAIEKEAIRQTLQAEGGNKAAAARSLGIAHSTLFEKLKRYGLNG